jgi:hypothetical protein
MKCPWCGRKMRWNKSGGYYWHCNWQIITREALDEEPAQRTPPKADATHSQEASKNE